MSETALTESAPAVTSPPVIPDLLKRVANGESIRSLSLEHGVARQTIYKWIFSGAGDAHYHDLMTEAMIARIAEADEELERSADKVSVARARAMAQLVRQDFERRRPKLYGPKQELEIDKQVHVHIHRTPQPVVVDGPTVEGQLASQQNHSESTDSST